MKFNKILIFLLTICILISAFVFSVSAENSITDLTNTYWVADNITYLDSATYYVNGVVTFNHGSGDMTYEFTYIEFAYAHFAFGNLDIDSSIFPYSNKHFIKSIQLNDGVDVKNSTLVNWFNNCFTLQKTECDGSSCSANDANLDGICDDCGLPMTMALRSPTLDELKASSPYYNYFIYNYVDTDTGEYIDTRLTFVSSNSPMTLTKSEWDRLNDSAWGNITYRFTSDSDIDGVNYVSHDNGLTWQRETTFSNGITLFNIDENIVSSTFDIFDIETGDLFFPLPLWVTTQGVTTEILNNQTLPTTVGTMKTLVVCGVGLMACLVALSLFGKVLGRYRKK